MRILRPAWHRPVRDRADPTADSTPPPMGAVAPPMAMSAARDLGSILPVVMYWVPAEKTPEVAAPMRMVAPRPLPTPVTHSPTPTATTAAAAMYYQLSLTHELATFQAWEIAPEWAWL